MTWTSGHTVMAETPRTKHYLVCRVAGRPRLALPLGPRALRLAAARRLQPTTWKRRVFREVVSAGVWLSLDRWLLRPSASPLPDTHGFALDRWLTHISDALGVRDLAAGIVWPPQTDRGRLYVHLLRDSGKAVGFAKVSLDQSNDALLEHEADALERVRASGLRRCRVPSVMRLDTWHGHRYLVLEPVDENARPVRVGLATFPQPWVIEYAGEPRRLDAHQVREAAWWQRFTEHVNEGDHFARAAEHAIEAGITVCRVHGDYGGHNLLRSQNNLWLLDWEHSAEQGPRRTDEVRLWLGLNQRRVLSSPAAAMRRFEDRFLAGHNDQARRDAIVALAFLHAVEIHTASVLIHHWRDCR